MHQSVVLVANNGNFSYYSSYIMLDIDLSQVWDVGKWVLLVLAAGFVGQFGRIFATRLIERRRRREEKEQGSASQRVEMDEAQAKLEKKRNKTDAKLTKKKAKAESKKEKKAKQD